MHILLCHPDGGFLLAMMGGCTFRFCLYTLHLGNCIMVAGLRPGIYQGKWPHVGSSRGLNIIIFMNIFWDLVGTSRVNEGDNVCVTQEHLKPTLGKSAKGRFPTASLCILCRLESPHSADISGLSPNASQVLRTFEIYMRFLHSYKGLVHTCQL